MEAIKGQIELKPELKGKLLYLENGSWVGSIWVVEPRGQLVSHPCSEGLFIAWIPNMSIILHLGETLYANWHRVLYQDQIGWIWCRVYFFLKEDNDIA